MGCTNNRPIRGLGKQCRPRYTVCCFICVQQQSYQNIKMFYDIFQKYLEMEDALEEDRKVTDEKVESLESIVRMLELKTKNSSDHSM